MFVPFDITNHIYRLIKRLADLYLSKNKIKNEHVCIYYSMRSRHKILNRNFHLLNKVIAASVVEFDLATERRKLASIDDFEHGRQQEVYVLPFS